MSEMTGYAQPLRAIGQALEILHVEQFEMQPEGDAFLVRGSARLNGERQSNHQVLGGALEGVWGAIPTTAHHGQWAPDRDKASGLSAIELHYTLGDVERLEEAGRARRGNTTESGDTSSLSQVMRSIGGYLNQKRARLLKLTREPDSLEVEYETSMGSLMKETFELKDLYDLWVRMYLQRTERAGH